MRIEFSPRAIALASQLARVIDWQPEPGQFVYDHDNVLPHTSPFQPQVFFILDLKHFVRYANSVEQLKQRMHWLPVWDDCLSLLEERGVSRAKVADVIQSAQAIEKHIELETLYQLIFDTTK